MSNIGIPIPSSPIGTVEIDGVLYPAIMPREWYRFFSLIQVALGGSTDTILDIIERFSPADPSSQALLVQANLSLDTGGQLSELLTVVAGLQQRISNLEAQLNAREEFPLSRIAALEIMMPGPSA